MGLFSFFKNFLGFKDENSSNVIIDKGFEKVRENSTSTKEIVSEKNTDEVDTIKPTKKSHAKTSNVDRKVTPKQKETTANEESIQKEDASDNTKKENATKPSNRKRSPGRPKNTQRKQQSNVDSKSDLLLPEGDNQTKPSTRRKTRRKAPNKTNQSKSNS